MIKFSIKRAAPLAALVVLAAALLAAASGLLDEPGVNPAADELKSESEAVNTDADLAVPAPGANRFEPSPDGEAAGTGAASRADSTVSETSVPRPLTRAELAEMLAAAFDLPFPDAVPFSDMQAHPSRRAAAAAAAAGVMNGWFDGTFRPEDSVSRADLSVAVVRALELEDTAEAHAPAEPVFRDVPSDHRAFAAVGMAHRLGLYPFHTGSFFAPDEPVQAAEARQMIRAAAALERLDGPVAFLNAPARTVGVQEDERRSVSFTADDEALIVRNGSVATLDALREDDEVRVVADAGGRLLVAVAEGPESADSAVMNEATKVLRELATPEQLAAIIARDWDRAGAELKVSLYNQLLEAGVTEEEATALLDQDWSSVEEHAKLRLTEMVSQRTEVDPELVRSMLDQDWDAAVSHIEVEVLEYVLNSLMQTSEQDAATAG